MGLYDRHYMKEPRGEGNGPPRKRRPRKTVHDAPWWRRLQFKLWLLLKGRK